jgi:hypothetical protein
MAHEETKYVPLADFITVVKILSSQINEFTSNIMALRAALMQSKGLPVPAEELKRLTEFFRDFEPIRASREAVENLVSSTNEDKSAELIELLRKFEGTIQ